MLFTIAVLVLSAFIAGYSFARLVGLKRKGN